MRQFPFVEELLFFFSFLETKVQFFERKLFLLAAPRAGTTPCKETSLVVALVDIMDFNVTIFAPKINFLNLLGHPVQFLSLTRT